MRTRLYRSVSPKTGHSSHSEQMQGKCSQRKTILEKEENVLQIWLCNRTLIEINYQTSPSYRKVKGHLDQNSNMTT